MAGVLTREDYRTYQIDPSELPSHLQDFIVAIESGNRNIADDGWFRLRYIIAPDPCGGDRIIERADLSEIVKGKLQEIRIMGNEGVYDFMQRKRTIIALAQDCVNAMKPKRIASDPRGKFAYKLVYSWATRKIDTMKAALALFQGEAEKKKWTPITQANGLKHVAKTYQKNSGADPIPKRNQLD